MGKNKLRRLLEEERYFKDKDCVKHKHIYSEECIIRVFLNADDSNIEYLLLHGGYCLYFHVMRCINCKSFYSISSSGSIMGLVQDISSFRNLPIYTAYTSKKLISSFKSMNLKFIDL